MIIAIEGIDGSGKGTQANLLLEYLGPKFEETQLISFPRYGKSRGAALIEDYLNGRLCVGIDDILGPAMFFALDRFEALNELRHFAANKERCLIVDRFVASNIAHQTSKENDKALRISYQNEIFRIEHEILGVPVPDLTILFDIDSELAQARVLTKPSRNYTLEPQDLHEKDANYLDRSSECYREILERQLYPNMFKIIIGVADDRKTIAKSVSAVIEPFLNLPPR